MRSNLIFGLCVTASLGLRASAVAQTTPAPSEHAGHGGAQSAQGAQSARPSPPASGHAGHGGMPGMPGMPGVQMAEGSGTSALLTGPLGTRSPSGTATFEGRTVRVTWSGDQPGTTRPWYVHRGSCGRDQGMVGPASAYQPIAVGARGTGSGTATLPAPLAASGTYYVAVHTGASGSPADVLACGALGSSGTGGGQIGQVAATVGTGAGESQMSDMDHSTMDHSTMDHSTMNMSGRPAAPGGAAMPMGPSVMRGAVPPTGTGNMATMMADHMRMMSDHMRMMAEHMSMMAQMSGGAAPAPARNARARPSGASGTRPARSATVRARVHTSGGAGGHAGTHTPGMAMPGAPVAGSRAAPRRPAPGTAPAKRPAAPSPKQDPMAGMDHSKMAMPGTSKP